MLIQNEASMYMLALVSISLLNLMSAIVADNQLIQY